VTPDPSPTIGEQQVADLDWTPVPDDALLDSLFILGPAAAPLVEDP
jgi:hypothetical protein